MQYGHISRCASSAIPMMLTIINRAAEAYRGVIPADCWHCPYMPAEALDKEVAAGVEFWGYRRNSTMIGIMGIQSARDVDLIRHAYVLPEGQRTGIGASLISHLRLQSSKRILVGTWAAASWAIRFYQKHGFGLVPTEQTPTLLKGYWLINDRQIETSWGSGRSTDLRIKYPRGLAHVNFRTLRYTRAPLAPWRRTRSNDDVLKLKTELFVTVQLGELTNSHWAKSYLQLRNRVNPSALQSSLPTPWWTKKRPSASYFALAARNLG